MKHKQRILAIFVIFGLAIFFSRQSMTEDEKYCSQYTGESNKDIPSQSYLACQNDTLCKTEDAPDITNHELTSDPDTFDFFCIPVGETPSDSQRDSLFPK